MEVALKRLFCWLKKQKVKFLFSVWPLSSMADELMHRIGAGEVRDLRQITPKDLPALIELVDRGLITIT